MVNANPTQLSPEALAEFKQIFQSVSGEALSDEAAEDIALRLLRVFNLLARSLPEEAEKALPVIHC